MVLTLLHGAYCVIAQAVLFRELGDLFKGNEAVLGLFLAAWLLGGGVGTWLFIRMMARLPEKPGRKAWGPAWAVFLSSFTLPLAVLAVRFLFSAYRFQALPSLANVSALAFLITAPVGAAAGFTFSFLAQRAFTLEKGDAAQAYLYEAAGAFGGGLLYAFFLMGRLDALALGLCIPAVILMGGWGLLAKRNRLIFILASLAWLALGFFGSSRVGVLSRTAQFHGSQLVQVSQSRYGSLELVADAGQTLAYYNGEVLYDPRATSWEEEAFLPALLRDKPSRILIPGFAPPPLIEQLTVLKPAKIVTMFPDENLGWFLTKELQGLGLLDSMPGFAMVSADPFRSLRAAEGPFDLILLSRDFPRTVADNRWFSDRFLKGLKAQLAPGGVVAVSVPYEENKPDAGTLKTLRIIRCTLSACFGYVDFAPGERFHLFASDSPLNLEQGEALRRLGSLRIKTKIFNRGWISHYLEPDRVSRFNQWTTPLPQDPVNGPFGPALYRASFAHWVRSESGSGWVMPILLVLILAVLLFRRLPRLLAAFKAGERSWALFIAGFAAMAVEVSFLEDYQALCGYLFNRFALLTGAFMLGTALGAWGVLRRGGRGSGAPLSPKGFAKALLSLALWAVGAGLLRTMDPSIPFVWFDTSAVFLNLLGGATSGVVFTLAARETRGWVMAAEANTSLYAFDLFGSAAAALLVPFALIPLGGTALTQGVAALLAAGFAIKEFNNR